MRYVTEIKEASTVGFIRGIGLFIDGKKVGSVGPIFECNIQAFKASITIYETDSDGYMIEDRAKGCMRKFIHEIKLKSLDESNICDYNVIDIMVR